MRKLAFISVAACLALLLALILTTGSANLITTFKKVPPGHILAALFVVQIQIVASACRWQFTARRLGHEIAMPTAIREYYVASALNLVLPGGMAGDALRAYRSRTEGRGGWKRPAAAVFLERLSGQFAFFAVSGAGLLLWPFVLHEHLPDHFDIFIWIFIGVLVMAAAFAVTLKNAWLPERYRSLGPELATVFWRRGAWLIQASLSLLIVASYIITFLIASDAVGAHLPAIAAFTIIPLCLMTMLIPAGVGGWGTREAAAAALWPLFGFTSADGLAASLLYGLLSLAGAAIPGVASVVISLFKGRIGRA